MIRRQFLKIIAQISVLSIVFKGQAEERVSSDLIPAVEPEAIIQFEQRLSLSAAPLSTGPLCGPSLVGSAK